MHELSSVFERLEAEIRFQHATLRPTDSTQRDCVEQTRFADAATASQDQLHHAVILACGVD
jgi:hypothetical protein